MRKASGCNGAKLLPAVPNLCHAAGSLDFVAATKRLFSPVSPVVNEAVKVGDHGLLSAYELTFLIAHGLHGVILDLVGFPDAPREKGTEKIWCCGHSKRL